MWEQYIRDLANFGVNAIELIPPRSDDAASSPHFPLPPLRMMSEMSRLADEYGLDVWVWYPALDKDYSDPAQVRFALDEWASALSKLPRVDALFVPGGDPVAHASRPHVPAAREPDGQPAPVSSAAADVDGAAGVQRRMDERVLPARQGRAGLAHRHRVRPTGARSITRLDTAETPLNNAAWLRARFAQIRAIQSEADRLAAIDRTVRWTDPGPDGFYDDLGDAGKQPHPVRARTYAEDPGGLESVFTGFRFGDGWRLSWVQHAETYYETSLEMRYTGLDPDAQNAVRIVYSGDQFGPATQVRLVANGEHEVHPYLTKPRPSEPLEFAVPRAATQGGTLTLTWRNTPGLGRFGKAVQIGEVRMVRR
jgi:hypothetical protein